MQHHPDHYVSELQTGFLYFFLFWNVVCHSVHTLHAAAKHRIRVKFSTIFNDYHIFWKTLKVLEKLVKHG